MLYCEYCSHKVGSPDHTCRSLRQQQELDLYSEQLNQWFRIDNRSIYDLETTSPEWFGKKITGQWLRKWCKRHDIPIQGISDRAKSSYVRQKYQQTVQKKYGVNNVSQSEIVKKRKILVNQERYGVDNPFQREEVIALTKQTLLEKYGVENARFIARKQQGSLSSPHRKVSEYLTSISVQHRNEEPNLFPKMSTKINRKYSPIPDIWIEHLNLVIEIYGNRWHANPEMYHASDKIKLFHGYSTAQEMWDWDAARVAHIKSFGVSVIILWEEDIKKRFDKVQKILYDAGIQGGQQNATG